MRPSTTQKLAEEATAIAHGATTAIVSVGRQRLEALYPLLGEEWQSAATIQKRLLAGGHRVSLGYVQFLVKAAAIPWSLELRQGKGVRRIAEKLSKNA